MNQTRVFLIFAWLMVATLLWMEWGKFNAPKPEATVTPSAQTTPGTDNNGAGVPSTGSLALPQSAVASGSSVATSVEAQAPATPSATAITITTDVLRLKLDGSRVLDAQLLLYPQSKQPGSAPVELFNEDPARRYNAVIAWTSPTSKAPGADAVFLPEQGGTEYALGSKDNSVSVAFLWRGVDGVSIRRTFTLKRGEYVVTVSDQVINAGTAPWQAFVYRQLERIPPLVKSGMTNPESFSLSGATWYSADAGYNRRPFKNYLDDGKVDQQISGGWIAMVQHHFFSAWIPQKEDKVNVSLDSRTINGVPSNSISEAGPGVNVAPGQQAVTTARLWVGPKLVNKIKEQNVPELDRAVDYSRFAIFAVIGRGLFWILSHLHSLLGNWGWSIIGLVVLVKLALWPLSAAQYRSANKMRQFQPRIAQLKERYGDDRQKFQMAQMELYKKEKINPMGGCLPILVTMPIFLALYWVLNESVELRQAPWFAWVQDLTARDPYFILPALNMLVMWRTQKMTPAVGMDPMQQKMMQFMPLVFGGMMAFFPSGLVLYWVTNGSLGLLQQWWLGRHMGKPPAAPEDKIKSKAKPKAISAK
ncbi:MAG: membrane protein insertase YidC [Pseudoxanthomonas sp.]